MTLLDDDHGLIAEALPVFASEGQEQIASIEQLLLQLEDAPRDRSLLDALFRCAHTVKGSAGLFGLDEVVAFTHHVETLLDRLREGQIVLTPSLSTLLLQCNDQIRQLIDLATGGVEDEGGPALRAALVQQLDAFHGSAAAPAPRPADTPAAAPAVLQRWQVTARFGPDTFRDGMDPLAILAYVAQLGRMVEVQCDASAVPPLETLDAERCHLGFVFTIETEQGRAAIEDAFAFVLDDTALDIREVDTAVVAAPPQPAPAAATDEAPARPREAASASATSADGVRYIRVQADRLDAVINLLGELVIAGAGALLLARQTRQGALVEANEQIGRLIEEIRNGTLQLRMVPIGETFSRFRRVVRDTAAELAKEVSLEISGGDTELDKSVVERIADPLMHLVRQALEHGLETPGQRLAAGKPAQGRLAISAFHESGSVVIRIADDGCGLGRDVARSDIEALRGTVTIASSEGQGRSVEIRLPLTLAIIDGFLVGVGASRFIFPLDAVVEVIENPGSALRSDAAGRSLIELRGQPLPVVCLRELYALEGPAPARCSVVVIRAGTQRCGVVVDQLLGHHQTVIKPLGRMLRSLRGISGSTILGNGDVALIFDVASLGQLAADAAVSSPRPTLVVPLESPLS